MFKKLVKDVPLNEALDFVNNFLSIIDKVPIAGFIDDEGMENKFNIKKVKETAIKTRQDLLLGKLNKENLGLIMFVSQFIVDKEMAKRFVEID